MAVKYIIRTSTDYGIKLRVDDGFRTNGEAIRTYWNLCHKYKGKRLKVQLAKVGS